MMYLQLKMMYICICSRDGASVAEDGVSVAKNYVPVNRDGVSSSTVEMVYL
jgi:hypothetical protein